MMYTTVFEQLLSNLSFEFSLYTAQYQTQTCVCIILYLIGINVFD